MRKLEQLAFSFMDDPAPTGKQRPGPQSYKAPVGEDVPQDQINDFQTPCEVADYMANMVPLYAYTILEPTPGKGNIVQALRRSLPAGGFDITAPADWWVLDKTLRFDAVVCNFPFSSKSFFNCPEKYKQGGMVVLYDQLEVVMEMSDRVIALVPWFVIIDSDVRTRALFDYGLISVTALPRKVFGYARIQTCILELEKGYKGETEFKYLKF